MKTKHTKGEWELSETIEMNEWGTYGIDIDVKHGEREIISIWGSSEGIDDETMANAKLVAAAPDLLSACQCVTDLYSEIERMVDGEVLVITFPLL